MFVNFFYVPFVISTVPVKSLVYNAKKTKTKQNEQNYLSKMNSQADKN